MSAAVLGSIYTMRRIPQPGEVGCPGACPLCAPPEGGRVAPCLACREEMRARLAEMQLAHYVERALN